MSSITISRQRKTSRTDSFLLSPTSPKSAFSFSIQSPKADEHIYHEPPPNASRSPCPALNALANHGFLPRDGRNITFGKIVDAMQNGLGLSHGFALFMAVGTFTLMRRPSLAAFDLHETDKHGYIEHNASITRDDIKEGQTYAPLEIDHERLHSSLLDKAHVTSTSGEKRVLTAEDVARARVELEGKSALPLAPLYAEIGRAEFAMVLEIFGFGENREVAQEEAQILLEEERFPDEWKPTHVLHLWNAVSKSGEIRKVMKKLQEEKPKPGPLCHADEEKHLGLTKVCRDAVEWMWHPNHEEDMKAITGAKQKEVESKL